MNINEMQLGAIALSPDILAKANIGLWAFELDEGSEPRMYVDDTMLGLIGLKEQVSPEKTYHAWYDNIDKGSYDLVAEAVSKMMVGHAEVQYPWHHPDGTTMVVRCGGVRNPEYTAGIRIEGTHQDVTKMLHFQEEIMNDMLDDEAIFLIDVSKGSRKTVHNRSLVAGEYSDEEKYTVSFNRYIDTYVAEADRGMLRQYTDPSFVMGQLEDRKKFTVEFRDIAGSRQRFYEMKFARFSDHEFLQSFLERDKEIVDKMIFNKLEEGYFALYGIDLDAGLVQILKDSAAYSQGGAGTVSDLSSAFGKFASLFEGEARAFFEGLGDVEYLRKKFASEDKASFTYKSQMVDKFKWVNVTELVLQRHKDGTPSLLTAGFSLLDEEASHKQDIQVKLKEDMHMIGGLASEYEALYYLDIDDNVFRIYSIDKDKDPQVSKLVSAGGDPFELLRRVGQSQMVHPDDRAQFADMTAETVRVRLAHSKQFSVRYRQLEGGDYRWHAMDVVKYEDVDERANAIAIGFADRDEEIHREQEQRAQLEKALYEAQAANRAKTMFLNSMSHDVRTPMNAIIGYTTMAQRYIDDKDKAMDYLGKIGTAGNNLLELINQVLDMSRIESGKVVLTEDPIDIVLRAYDMTEIIGNAAQAKNIKLATNINQVTDRMVFADAGRMNQLVMNILGNAVKYTPEGGRITFTVTQVDCDKDGFATYVLTTEDNGIGMSQEFLEKIYEPFSREDTTTVSKIQGTGLGMAIVKKLVDLMGGSIDIESEKGRGTKIAVTLSFKLQKKAALAAESASNVDLSRFKGKRALLVEDNELNREIATMILEEQGVIVNTAEDGDIAIEKLKSVAERGDWDYYDFVLMDIQMPRMSGYEATKVIRSIPVPEGIHLPIIAMTANAFAEDRQLALDAGMDEHIAKPIDVKVLWQTLAKFI